MSFRRGWTHGVLAQLLLPIALTGSMLVYDRYRRRKRRRRRSRRRGQRSCCCSRTSACCCTSSWTSLNSYGVRLLMPFSERWFYGDALYIVDPWLYLLLGARLVAGVAAGHPRPRAARIGVALAAIYIALMLGIERDRAARGARRPGARRPSGRHALHGDAGGRQSLSARSRDRLGDRYEKGNLWFEPLPHFRPAGFGVDKATRRSCRRSRRCRCRWRGPILRWSRFPFVQVNAVGPPTASGSTITATRTSAPMAGRRSKLRVKLRSQ